MKCRIVWIDMELLKSNGMSWNFQRMNWNMKDIL